MTHDSILEFTGGDRAAAVQLKRSLNVLSEHFAGQPIGRQIDDVLFGRAAFRDLASDPEFASMAHAGMTKFAQEWEAASPEERQSLLRAGEAAEVAINDELDPPATLR